MPKKEIDEREQHGIEKFKSRYERDTGQPVTPELMANYEQFYDDVKGKFNSMLDEISQLIQNGRPEGIGDCIKKHFGNDANVYRSLNFEIKEPSFRVNSMVTDNGDFVMGRDGIHIDAEIEFDSARLSEMLDKARDMIKENIRPEVEDALQGVGLNTLECISEYRLDEDSEGCGPITTASAFADSVKIEDILNRVADTLFDSRNYSDICIAKVNDNGLFETLYSANGLRVDPLEGYRVSSVTSPRSNYDIRYIAFNREGERFDVHPGYENEHWLWNEEFKLSNGHGERGGDGDVFEQLKEAASEATPDIDINNEHDIDDENIELE